jgi:16S rRNA processing protein RimM
VIPVPGDLIVVARVIGASGIRGAIKLIPENTPNSSVLLACRNWWLNRGVGALVHWRTLSARQQGTSIVASLAGLSDRDQALALKGSQVWVSRADFPMPSTDEYYWVDLIGCAVVNVQDQMLGQVVDLMDHGAHPILVAESATMAAAGEQILIPFVAQYLLSVDIKPSAFGSTGH